MQTAKLFKNGHSQALRLPAEFRFEGNEVEIRRDPATGDVILSPPNKPFADLVGGARAPARQHDGGRAQGFRSCLLAAEWADPGFDPV